MNCSIGERKDCFLSFENTADRSKTNSQSDASLVVIYEEQKLNHFSTIASSSLGVTELVLSGPKEGAFSYVDRTSEHTDPAYNGTIADYLKYAPGSLREQLKNKVKLCPACDKPNAYNLAHCNACNYFLTNVDISFIDNVFTGFIFGIAKTNFPLTISMRYQSPTIMVIDDLLQLAPVHLNCIYAEKYLSDFRSLYVKPRGGLALLQHMFDKTWKVIQEQFLTNKPFREKWSTKSIGLSNAEVRKHLVCGVNFPPSQYQLHLQVMLPPFMPFHYQMYRDGKHFTMWRFFPYEYLISTLKALNGKPIHSAHSMGIFELLGQIKSKTGISYEDIYADQYKRYGESHKQLASWRSEDFERVIVDGTSIVWTEDMSLCKSQDVAAARKYDTQTLQNYGRPYINGAPSGTFYKYAKKAPLRDWLSA